MAEVVVNEFVCRFGVPLEIHSDQGRNFESAVFTEMCNLLGMKKTRTTPLHPQSDGMVERFNRTIETQLAMFVEEHQRNWDEHLPLLLMSYRTAIHNTTGCTPAKLMLGRNLRVPVDLLYPRPEKETTESLPQYVKSLQDRLERVQDFARTHLKVASDRMKLHYDTRASTSQFNRGDPVWLYNPQRKKGISPKLMRPWKGPFTVTKCLNDLVYRIQLGPRTKPKVVHRNRLWKYSGANPPCWLTELDAKNSSRRSADGEAGLSEVGPTPGRAPVTSHPQLAEEPTGDTESVTDSSEEVDTTVGQDVHLPYIPDVPEGTGLRRSHRRQKSPDRYGHCHPGRVTWRGGSVAGQ